MRRPRSLKRASDLLGEDKGRAARVASNWRPSQGAKDYEFVQQTFRVRTIDRDRFERREGLGMEMVERLSSMDGVDGDPLVWDERVWAGAWG